ncbi:MAG: DHHW family protein [bacterium]|nr:DHHW family protein [bacterium]
MKKKTDKKRTISSIIYLFLTLGVFVCAGLLMLLLPQKEYSVMENRYLTKAPQVNITGVLSGEVQEQLTKAAADQFPLRNMWMQIATSYRSLMNRKEIDGVYIGKDGALFNRVTDTDFEWNNYEKNLDIIRQAAGRSGADWSVMLVPGSGIILSEALPKGAVMYDSERAYAIGEQIFANEKLHWLDTRETLEAASRKENRPVYYRTDHHWTSIGAYEGAKVYADSVGIALDELDSYGMTVASENFLGTVYSKVPGLPGVMADTILLPEQLPEGLVIETAGPPADALSADGKKEMPILDGIYDKSKLSGKDQYAVFFGGNYSRISIKNPQAEHANRKLLLIKDSYANSMVPYLISQYGEITMLDMRYFTDSFTEFLSDEQPDEVLVLYEMSNFASDRSVYKLLMNQ